MRLVAAVLIALVLACGSVAPGRAEAPDYPNGKITFIVGFAPGGGLISGTVADAGGAAEVGLDHDLKERERELIFATLRVTGGSRKLAAERLGISPRTLRHKLQQFKQAGVSVPQVHESHYVTA